MVAVPMADACGLCFGEAIRRHFRGGNPCGGDSSFLDFLPQPAAMDVDVS